jgi:hypothetical protein
MSKYERREPCGNCPFLKSAKLAYWAPTEYLKLKRVGATETMAMGGRSFMCHKDKALPDEDKGLCVGWLIYQKRRGIPSIALRVKLMTDNEACDQYNEADTDEELYDSIDELVQINLLRDRELHPERYGDTEEDE